MARRDQDTVFFDHEDAGCLDSRYHRRCRGRWRGVIDLGRDGSGRRRRKKVSGRSKSDVINKLKDAREELDKGIKAKRNYTVQDAVDDWLAHGLEGRAPKTVETNKLVLTPLMKLIGQRMLKELTATELRTAFRKIGTTRSTRTLQVAHNALERAIRHAEASDLVARNVASLIRPPEGKAPGRPSKALTAAEAEAVLRAADDSWLGAYFHLSMLTGIRTEEARAVRDDHLDLDGNPNSDPPVPPHVAVWRSVRLSGDTKTPRSRRTLALPERAVASLRKRIEARDKDRVTAGEVWEEHCLVFCNGIGQPLSAAVVRHEFKNITETAGIGRDWTPRELRHSFVSLMSGSGMPVEEIARLVGHSSSRTTEVIYRFELRPVLQSGAKVMEQVLATKPRRKVVRRPRPAAQGSGGTRKSLGRSAT
jgi:integrase